ncbi:MAG: valine--tRNA ligase [Desulfobacterales bacterium]|nr:valine--tRNA ligase [Desulfobacterales bacterium]
MSSNSLDQGYDPQRIEDSWYEFWEKEHLFAAGTEDGCNNYSIVIPPPNVTGVLHMGHALNITLQDILCRYKRLQGENVLWVPGTDHAGIATQNVVEKKLAAEGRDRHDLGRDKFVEEVWEWREEYGSAIINQLKKIGASCDWSRERFTMDEGLSKAVKKVFVQLYEEGLIYRGDYIINWCPRCHTALADLEVEYEELEGNLYHIKYPFEGSSDGLIVATTRPETMLGDTAVAVNPDDERYTDLKFEEIILPLMNRKIPIIRDAYVETEFGTGALKVTPAHDPNDFEIGTRHKLPNIKVIGDDGKMTAAAGRFEGLDRFECRKAVLKALEEEGLLIKIESNPHNVGHCYRCKTVVEPNLSKQWFVSVKPLAKKAIEAVESGKTKIIPEIWTANYYDWMYNIRDWCISRQIWWGHRIPAWTCEDCGEVIVTMEDPDKCPACSSEKLARETDVLDTWFSSALWPFSTMGWPENTDLLKQYYPTSVLITGFDILFFWVARMMMMGIHFMDEVPFDDVYIHALVRDEEGKKMSKSKGNVIDPLKVIDEYGTDAFRYTLTAFAAQGRDIKMSEQRVEGYRHFVNKLWNVARFAMMHFGDSKEFSFSKENLELSDRWILSRLNHVAATVKDALDTYRFNDAASALYKFVWHELCDWYVEISKPTLYGKKGEERQKATMGVLWQVLRDTLVLLHPIIPFVTEELWHKLPDTEGSIMKASIFHDGIDLSENGRDMAAENDMKLVTDIISGIRNIRGEMNIAPSMVLNVIIQAEDEMVRDTAKIHEDIIMEIGRLESFTIEAPGDQPTASATAIVEGVSVFVSLEGIIDFAEEIKRLEKELGKIAGEIMPLAKKLNNDGFLGKAPADVVEKVKEKHQTMIEKQEILGATIERIKSLEKS